MYYFLDKKMHYSFKIAFESAMTSLIIISECPKVQKTELLNIN